MEMISIPFYLLGALLPNLILLTIVWLLDRKEKEPFWLIFVIFTMGSLSCFPIGIVEFILEMILSLFVEPNTFFYNFILYFFIVALCEEGGKFIIVVLLSWWNKHFTHRFDAIVYCVAASIGFSTLENVMYVFSTELGGMNTMVTRAFLAVPGHFAWAVLMGLFYGYVRKYYNKKEYGKMILHFSLMIFVPAFVHGFYDFLVTSNSVILILFMFCFVFIVDIITLIILIWQSKNDKAFWGNNWLQPYNIMTTQPQEIDIETHNQTNFQEICNSYCNTQQIVKNQDNNC